jgi:hypothetical protein
MPALPPLQGMLYGDLPLLNSTVQLLRRDPSHGSPDHSLEEGQRGALSRPLGCRVERAGAPLRSPP